MKAATQHKIKRVVITSSVAAIKYTNDPTKLRFTTADWSDVDTSTPYTKSKTLAEKAAWDYLKKLPESERFELATICPGFIVGPNLNTCNFESGNAIKKFMLREVPVTVNSKMPMIDVRDCALAHYRALLVPEAAGRRFILANESLWLPEIAQVLHKEFGKFYDIPLYVVPKFLLSFAGNFVPMMKMFAKSVDQNYILDDYDTMAILGVKRNIPI